MLIAIVVPEGVLWCAWEQWWTARKLRQQVNAIISQEHTEISGDDDEECRVCKVEDKQEAKSVITEIVPVDDHAEPEPENTAESIEGSITRTESAASTPQKEEILVKREEPWTLEQAFFALAGGYALPSTDPSLPPVPLTANGVLLLCRLGVLPSTPPSAISDKSKADAFAKALVCVQAGWFIVQMIARAIAKLPITTLEVHVLAHVLCAFAIYAVWFEKGYDIGDAIVIDSEEGRALGALFEMEGVEVSYISSCNRSELMLKTNRAIAMISQRRWSNAPAARLISTLPSSAYVRARRYDIHLQCTGNGSFLNSQSDLLQTAELQRRIRIWTARARTMPSKWSVRTTRSICSRKAMCIYLTEKKR